MTSAHSSAEIASLQESLAKRNEKRFPLAILRVSQRYHSSFEAAVRVAADFINENDAILPHYRLEPIFINTTVRQRRGGVDNRSCWKVLEEKRCSLSISLQVDMRLNIDRDRIGIVLRNLGTAFRQQSRRDAALFPLLVGPTSSQRTLRAAPFLRELNVVVLGVYVTHPVFSDERLYPNVFRIPPAPRFAHEAMVALMRHFGWLRNVAVLSLGAGWSEAEAIEMIAVLERAGGHVSVAEKIR